LHSRSFQPGAKALLVFSVLVSQAHGLAQMPAASGRPTLDTLPRAAVSSRHSFVVAAGGKSRLFHPSAGIEAPFLDNVYRPFGFSSDSRYFLYLKSKGAQPTFDLYSYDLINGTEKKLSEEAVYSAAWSPESLKIAYISMESATSYRLNILDLVKGQTRLAASGLLNPEHLEWDEDGNGILYDLMKPAAEDYFHSGKIDMEPHRIGLQSFDDQAIPPADGLAGGSEEPGLRSSTARAIRRAGPSGTVFVSEMDGSSSVVKRWNEQNREYELLGRGQVYDATRDGVVIREFVPGGVSFSFANATSGTMTPLYMFTATWKLPFEGSADLNQGGSLFSGGACDGRNCNVVSHNNALGYALDWQQRPNQGMGNTRILAVEDGTVAALATNVTCNSLNTTCQIGWDNYSTQCTNSNGGAGNYVVLAHPDGSFSFYGHMRSGTSPLIVGQAVVRGTYLGDQGHSGSTGSQNGNYNGCGDHIHFQRQTGPAVWAQSVPTDFTELPCALSCRTNYTSQNAEVSVPAAVAVLTVQLSPSTVWAGSSTPANRVILPAPAPTGGTSVSLTASSGDVTVPAAVSIPAGSTYATFNITVSPTTTPGTVTITAQDGVQTASADLTVKAIGVYSVNLNPVFVVGGSISTANEVVLTAPAATNASIDLTSTNPAATVPSSIPIDPAASFASFAITTSPVSSMVSGNINATFGTSTRSAGLNVGPLNLSSITLTSTSAVGGTSVFGNRANFNGATPADAIVNLSSSNSSVVSVPATVTLLQGNSFVTFPMTTYQVTSATAVTITATYNGISRTANVTVQPTVPSALTLGSLSVAGGATVNGNKVTLNGPAAAPNGTAVALSSSDPSVASVPPSVTVAAGATVSPTFPITTTGVNAVTTVAITATLNGVSRTVNLTVNPVSLSSITLGATSATGGTTVANNKVTLTGPAGPAGVTVLLSSSDPSIAAVPASISVAAGTAVSPVFNITTSAVAAATPVTITADLNGTVRSVVLTVNPVSITSVTLASSSNPGGVTLTGNRVNLSGPAPASGFTVTLGTSDSSVATVPNTITITAGATQGTFAITTFSVAASTPVTITATANGITRSTSLTVTPVALISLTLGSSSAVGGTAVTGNRVTLNGPAGPNGLTVVVTTSDSNVATAADVTIPAGATQATFAIGTSYVSSASTVTITATYNGISRSANLTVNPVSLLSVTLPSGSTVGGVQVTGTATLSGFAPPAGITVVLGTSDSSLATVPASVSIAGGAKQATFPITTYNVTATTPVTILGTYSGVTRQVNLNLNPTAPSSISLSATSVVGGSPLTNNRVVLNGPAAPAGSLVTLASSDPTIASVPASVTVVAGAINSPFFTITTTGVTVTTSVTITATLNGISRTATVNVQPITPTKVTLTNSSITGGSMMTGNRVYITGQGAADGSTVIALSSSDTTAATVPASITVAAGATSQPFPITTYVVTAPTSVTITATINGVSRSATLTVNP
jgi:hypothetical protein